MYETTSITYHIIYTDNSTDTAYRGIRDDAQRKEPMPEPIPEPVLSHEEQWVKDNLNHRTRYWDEMVVSGRADLTNCPESLKSRLEAFADIYSEIQSVLENLNYEAG